MPVADLADALEVARNGGHGPGGGPDHGFGDEGHDRLWAKALDLGLQLVGGTLAVGLLALALRALAVFVAGRDVGGFRQKRRELGAPPRVAARRQRAQRVAVVALPPGDDPMPVGLADLKKILARKLQRRLYRL